jgi:hypothetical protein
MSWLGIVLLLLTQISLSAQDQAREAAIEQFRALGLLEGVGQASRRPLEAPRHRKVGGSVVCGGGQMYVTGRLENQNGNSGSP